MKTFKNRLFAHRISNLELMLHLQRNNISSNRLTITYGGDDYIIQCVYSLSQGRKQPFDTLFIHRHSRPHYILFSPL